jgi:PAS domain S-box-containing protein
MTDWVARDPAQHALERRIRELEEENSRLSRELQVLSYDIHEHKKAEAALAESERQQREIARLLELDQARLAAVLRDLPVGVWIADQSGRLIGSNEAADRIWAGKSPLLDSTTEYHQYVAWHPETGTPLRSEEYPVAVALQTGQPVEPMELRIRRFDGSEGTVLVSAVPIKDREGQLTGAVGVNVDITERKQMEQALRESEQLYRAIGEAIPYGIWICDPQGRNLYASQSYLDLVGITQEQCSEFGWGDTLHPDDRERTIAAWKECVRTEGLWDIEHRFLGKDGQYHPILARGIPVRNEAGKIIYWAGINLDISRLKKAEQKLAASEEHFQVAIKNSPILVYTTDRELRYTWIYNAPFGATEEQVIGKTDEELNGPENPAELVALKRSVLETGVGKRQEIRWRYQGREYFYDLTVEPIRNETGEITGLTVAAIDITEKRHLEQAAHESEVQMELQRRLMEQRERERLTIAQEIHDGPTQTLASALLQLELSKTRFRDPTLSDALDPIAQNVKEAIRELRDILAELRPPLLERFGLSSAMRTHAHEFRQKYPELKLTHDISEDQGKLSEEACLSLFRIYQEALNNIVRHAYAKKAHVRFYLEENAAVLEVEDNGKGLEVIPDLTFHTENGHYGLAGMKERAEAVHGEFELRSAKGDGTAVIVRIPIHHDPLNTG